MPFSRATTSEPIGRSPSCDCPLATFATGSMLGPPETKVGSTPNFVKLPSSTPAKKPPYWMLLIQDNWNDSGCACCAKAAPRPIIGDANVAMAAADTPPFNTRRRVGSKANSMTGLRVLGRRSRAGSKRCAISLEGRGELSQTLGAEQRSKLRRAFTDVGRKQAFSALAVLGQRRLDDGRVIGSEQRMASAAKHGQPPIAVEMVV